MKIKIEWVLIIAMAAIFILTTINSTVKYKSMEKNYLEIISGLGELKKVNSELWEKTQTAIDNIDDVKKDLSDFGKSMVKDDDLKGLFVALTEIKESVSGHGEVSEKGKVSFKGNDSGFEYKGYTMYPSGKYEIDFGMSLQLEGYAKEISHGVYETYIQTNNPKVVVKKFVFKIEPLKYNFWKRFEFGIGLRYNIDMGAGVVGSVKNESHQIDIGLYKGIVKDIGVEFGYVYYFGKRE